MRSALILGTGLLLATVSCSSTPSGRVLVVPAPVEELAFDAELSREAAAGLAGDLAREGIFPVSENPRRFDAILISPHEPLAREQILEMAGDVGAEMIFHVWIQELRQPEEAGSSTGGVAILDRKGRTLGSASGQSTEPQIAAGPYPPEAWQQARIFARGRLEAIRLMVEKVNQLLESRTSPDQ